MGMPNPFAGYPITDGWAEHLARGSRGGIDWGTPVGTPIPAPAAGTVTYEAGSGTGGYIITLAFRDAPGYRMQFLHCSSFNGSNRSVSAGELLGRTGGAAGAPGSGSSTGPHVHVHMIDPNGVRINPLPWFDGSSSPAPSSNVQAEIQSIMTAQGLYSGPIDGAFGINSWKAVQTWLSRYSLYSGAIDGIPGPNTYRGFQSYAAKNGNYDGPIDGVLGPRSWAGFVQSLKEDTAPAPKPPTPPTPTPPKPITPTNGLTPAQQQRLAKLTEQKKDAEAKLATENKNLSSKVSIQQSLEKAIVTQTAAFNKAKEALTKATADLTKSKNEKVVADKEVTTLQTTIASLQKNIAKYVAQIDKLTKEKK